MKCEYCGAEMCLDDKDRYFGRGGVIVGPMLIRNWFVVKRKYLSFIRRKLSDSFCCSE